VNRATVVATLCAGAACGLASPVPTWASIGSPSVGYLLRAESTLQEGCQDPCDCAIFVSGLEGSFTLTALDREGDFERYDVTDVRWTIRDALDGGDIPVTGFGMLHIDRGQVVQRLELDLVIGDHPVVHFDSGLVPIVAEFPVLDVAIARNGFYCYDQVFTVRATPETVGTPVETTRLGGLKARYGRPRTPAATGPDR
jgi:hypothetical protein